MVENIIDLLFLHQSWNEEWSKSPDGAVYINLIKFNKNEPMNKEELMTTITCFNKEVKFDTCIFEQLA